MFDQIMSKIKTTPEWAEMENTVENSHYHREANVAVHTLMTLAAYDVIAPDRTPRQQLLTRLCLAFHDTGKPDAEETLTNDDGSTRRRYAGHELISANSFVNFVTSHPDITRMIYDAGLSPDDLRVIRFMIEHHLPYGLKKHHKRVTLKSNLVYMLGDDLVCFYDMLRSDSRGRISDDHAAKLQAVEEWIAEFEKVEAQPIVPMDDEKPTMLMMVATSGSGKSTWAESRENFKVFSLDTERMKFADHLSTPEQRTWLQELKAADPNAYYDTVYELATGPNKAPFKAFAHASYLELIAARENVIVDNMNIAKKGRAFFIQNARQAGYNVASVECWVPLQTVLDRQNTRPDKKVPGFAVRQAYLNIQLPLLTPSTVNANGKRVLNPEGEVDAYHQLFPF